MLQQLCFSSLFHYFVSILHICLNIRDKNQKRFVTYLKGFLCFHVYVFFLLFFFFLLIGEKVNTQWLSHAIFDPVVSWSYFFNLSFYSMILLFLFQCLFCVTWVLGVCFVNDDWVIFFVSYWFCTGENSGDEVGNCVCVCTWCECFVALLSSSSCEGSSFM